LIERFRNAALKESKRKADSNRAASCAIELGKRHGNLTQDDQKWMLDNIQLMNEAVEYVIGKYKKSDIEENKVKIIVQNIETKWKKIKEPGKELEANGDNTKQSAEALKAGAASSSNDKRPEEAAGPLKDAGPSKYM